MRTLFILFVSLFSFLLKGNAAVAPTGSDMVLWYAHGKEIAKSQADKNASTDWGCTLLEDADLDFGDDTPGDDISVKHFSVPFWVAAPQIPALCPRAPGLSYQDRCKTFPPFCGKTSPIYLTNRVFRL